MRKDVSQDRNLLEELGYETKDVKIRPIMFGILALFVFVAVTCGLSVWLYKFFEPPYKEYRVPAFAAKRKLPPVPQVQANPKDEMIQYHAAVDATKVGESIQKAKDELVAAGIAGVAQGADAPRQESYPGSGDYRREGRP